MYRQFHKTPTSISPQGTDYDSLVVMNGKYVFASEFGAHRTLPSIKEAADYYRYMRQRERTFHTTGNADTDMLDPKYD